MEDENLFYFPEQQADSYDEQYEEWAQVVFLLTETRPDDLAEDMIWHEYCECSHLSEEHYWAALTRKYEGCSWCSCEKFTSKVSHVITKQ